MQPKTRLHERGGAGLADPSLGTWGKSKSSDALQRAPCQAQVAKTGNTRSLMDRNGTLTEEPTPYVTYPDL